MAEPCGQKLISIWPYKIRDWFHFNSEFTGLQQCMFNTHFMNSAMKFVCKEEIG